MGPHIGWHWTTRLAVIRHGRLLVLRPQYFHWLSQQEIFDSGSGLGFEDSGGQVDCLFDAHLNCIWNHIEGGKRLLRSTDKSTFSELYISILDIFKHFDVDKGTWKYWHLDIAHPLEWRAMGNAERAGVHLERRRNGLQLIQFKCNAVARHSALHLQYAKLRGLLHNVGGSQVHSICIWQACSLT